MNLLLQSVFFLTKEETRKLVICVYSLSLRTEYKNTFQSVRDIRRRAERSQIPQKNIEQISTIVLANPDGSDIENCNYNLTSMLEETMEKPKNIS